MTSHQTKGNHMLDQRQECLDAIRIESDHRALAGAFIATIHDQIDTLSEEIQQLERIKTTRFWQTEAGQKCWNTLPERLSTLEDRMRTLQILRAETMDGFEMRRAKD